MLGKLFNLTSGNGAGAPPSSQPSSKPVSSLESVQEDIHTRNLLFPDTQALYQHRHDQVFPLSTASALPSSTSNAFDYNGDIDMDTRDVRVVIMQDTLSSVPASLLYDSQPPPPPAVNQPAERPSTTAGASHPALQDARRNPTSPRKTSLSQSSRPVVIQPESPQPRQSAFGRRASVQGRSQSRIETDAQRALREYGEEIATFSSCIFGNNEFLAYKGTSTKVHVMPTDPRNDIANSIIGDGRGSVGRSSMRSSKLSQSFSSEMVSPFNPSSSATRAPERRRVLITRLFPVNIPDDNKSSVTPQGRYSEDSSGYPFPASVDDGPGKPKKATPKMKRTPMYAVALIINLPQGPSQSTATSAARSTFRGPGSYTEQESYPSSFSSTRRAGWTMVGNGSGMDSFDSGYSTDAEDRIDFLTQHWDIIMRTLTHLQSVVATNLFSMLKQADMVSPDPLPTSISEQLARTPSLSSRRSQDGGGPVKPPKVNFKSVYLLPNCLADDRKIRAEVEIAKARIVSGLCAARVVTGQNRWGIWREEARWVSRWAGGRDQGFFFFNLLTGFLSVHTDWLQALSPSKYRKQYFLQQKAKGEEDLLLPVRTVIVGQDKMAARRVVFLLSAFLPSNQQLASMRTHRPSTSASYGAFSQSPPSYIVPILKEESLRRKINRRGAPRQSSHSRNVSMQTPSTRSSIPAHLAHLSMDNRRHERRVSDAASIKTTNIPILSNDFGTRKSSAATTTTITPETSIPHFATAHGIESQFYARPGSSSSVAADDLKRSLKRGDSSGQYSSGSADSRQSSRWGSVIGGLWGTRKRDSTHTTVQSRDSVGSRDSFSSSPRKSITQRRVSLGRMVEEAQMVDSPVKEEPPDSTNTAPQTPRTLLGDTESLRGGPPESRRLERTPDPNGAFESPVKTTINADDGVIDVDVPFPDYLTSFETAVSSPSSSGYLSTPGFGSGLEAFEQACRLSMDGDMPMNVAGWLQCYHPDFVLQAIPSSPDLVDQVKASLRAEPTPISTSSMESYRERWVDVSCALIADTTNFSISLIRYRRLVKPKPAADRGTPLLSGSVNSHTSAAGAALTPSLSPYERCIEEEFTEEPIVTLDETLIEAVERVVALGAAADVSISKDSSAASSRSVSERRGSASESTGSEDLLHLPTAPHPPPLEVPRGECKTVVLSALEEIVREVIQKKDHPSRGGNGRGPRAKESVLKDAVRVWIESVEAGE